MDRLMCVARRLAAHLSTEEAGKIPLAVAIAPAGLDLSRLEIEVVERVRDRLAGRGGAFEELPPDDPNLTPWW